MYNIILQNSHDFKDLERLFTGFLFEIIDELKQIKLILQAIFLVLILCMCVAMFKYCRERSFGYERRF